MSKQPEQPKWDGNPRKLDHLQRRDQAESWKENKEISPGIRGRGGYTEVARVGDSIQRMAIRAYETAKNYPNDKARIHGAMISRVLKTAYPDLDKIRIRPGDRLKITEKEVVLSTMDKFGAHTNYRIGIGSP